MGRTVTLLLVRPVCFGFNPETAVNNFFQHEDAARADVQERALREFDGLVRALESRDIPVLVLPDSPEPVTPDSIFPNNWVSSHEDGTLVLYPMFAPNRRLERKPEIVRALVEATGVVRLLDLTGWEKQNLFLEGTGSMVLDRSSRTAYACLGPRTSPEVLADFCRQLGYEAVPFKAVDSDGRSLYHTNLMMSVGTSFAVLCREAFVCAEELEKVEDNLRRQGKRIVDITWEQMMYYTGNILEIKSRAGERFILMSETARRNFREDQLAVLTEGASVLSAPVPTIEQVGGGSVRCMVAELF